MVQNIVMLVIVDQMVICFVVYLVECEGVEDVIFDDEQFCLVGINFSFIMLEVVVLVCVDGCDDLLIYLVMIELVNCSFFNGCYIVEVEVDQDIGFVMVDSYVVVDDFGNLINLMFVEGQVYGGVV